MAPLRVLLVDDEEDLVNTLVERLRLRGIEADGVFRGMDAIDSVTRTNYDVIVLDLKMPGLSGAQLMEPLHDLSPGVPIIVMTGHGAIRDGEKAVKDGAYDYLVKPFDIETLIQRMKDATDSG